MFFKKPEKLSTIMGVFPNQKAGEDKLYSPGSAQV